MVIFCDLITFIIGREVLCFGAGLLNIGRLFDEFSVVCSDCMCNHLKDRPICSCIERYLCRDVNHRYWHSYRR